VRVESSEKASARDRGFESREVFGVKVLLLGAGMMARAIAYSLARRDAIEEIVVADRERSRAEGIAEWLSDRRVVPQRLDVSARRLVCRAMEGHAVAISAVPYFFNLSLAEAAVEAGVHFCDLGGNNRIVAAELGLHERAKRTGVTLIPDCGLAPGLVNVLAADAIRGFERVDSVAIRVGGLPQRPRPPLGYEIVFSPYGLVNEYMEASTVIVDGRIVEVPSLSGLEEIAFPPLYEDLEAFHTSGGSSTLPQTLLGRVRNLDYKTIRYRGHLEKVKAMADLGFFDLEPRTIDRTKVVPRELAVSLLAERLSFGEPDVVLLRVTASGEKEGRKVEVRYEMIDRHDSATGLSAMMRTTGFPIAEVALLLATGEITARGAIPQELCVPADRFLDGLRGQGLSIARTESEG
jgi:lysine 6-dehydrogenase